LSKLKAVSLLILSTKEEGSLERDTNRDDEGGRRRGGLRPSSRGVKISLGSCALPSVPHSIKSGVISKTVKEKKYPRLLGRKMAEERPPLFEDE